MKKLITVLLLLFTAMAFQAQEALRNYTTEMSGIETLTDMTQKSKSRGNALATFFNSRTAETGKETAINETVPYLRQLVEYDFYGAYNFLLKVKNQDDAQMFMKNHLSKDERALVRIFASNSMNNWQSGGYPANVPQPGYGLKGKWTTGTLTANTTNTNNNNNNYTAVQTQTNDNGMEDLRKGLAAYQAKNHTEALKGFKKAAEKENIDAMYNLGVLYYNGEGVTQNETEAFYWYKKAADKGFEKAKTALQQLQTQHPQNLTAFKDANGKWGFKDDKNKIIVQPKYDKTKPFAEGMAAVGITEEGAEKWGYIDQNGKEIIPLIYGDAIRFSEGLAAVRPVGKTWGAYYGFIDKSGKLVIPHEYPFVFDTKMYDGWVFTDGKAKVYKDKRIFYIDKTGKEVKDGTAAAQAQELKAFSDKPFDRFGKWGFKDQNGKIIVAPKYNSFHPFREGLATVSIGGSYDEEFDVVLGSRYGFIDNTGKEVIALKYESINDGFYEGLAAVKLNGKWGYINTAGKEVIPFQYSEAFIFIKGKAKVNKDGRTFYIDKNGKEIQ